MDRFWNYIKYLYLIIERDQNLSVEKTRTEIYRWKDNFGNWITEIQIGNESACDKRCDAMWKESLNAISLNLFCGDAFVEWQSDLPGMHQRVQKVYCPAFKLERIRRGHVESTSNDPFEEVRTYRYNGTS